MKPVVVVERLQCRVHAPVRLPSLTLDAGDCLAAPAVPIPVVRLEQPVAHPHPYIAVPTRRCPGGSLHVGAYVPARCGIGCLAEVSRGRRLTRCAHATLLLNRSP